jgi:transposase
MLSLSLATRIFVAIEPLDMRKSFNGLQAAVHTVLAQDIQTGHIFLFSNRLRNRVKAVFWDGTGVVVYAKRLERGRFGWPRGDGPSRSLRPEELTLLLHGIEGHSRAHWYRR